MRPFVSVRQPVRHKTMKNKILLLILLGIILIILSFVSFFFKKAPVKVPPPQPVWITYTSQNLGISFDYPEKIASVMENKEKLADGTIIDTDKSVFLTIPGITCGFEHTGYFVIEVSNTPPERELLSYLTTPQVVGDKEGKGSTYVPMNLQTDGRDSEMILVENNNKYYLIKDETCISEVGKQILNSIKFL